MGHSDRNDGCLLSIGYGDRPWCDFYRRLCRYRIRFLVDVRSKPQSRQPEFNAQNLKALASHHGIHYHFLGSALGGLPEDPACYVDGKVDYTRCEQSKAFQSGIERLCEGAKGGHRIVIMCSELDPEKCHRSKLVGEAVQKRGIMIGHIDRDGDVRTQHEVIARLTGGQSHLFCHEFRSNGTYADTSYLSS